MRADHFRLYQSRRLRGRLRSEGHAPRPPVDVSLGRPAGARRCSLHRWHARSEKDSWLCLRPYLLDPQCFIRLLGDLSDRRDNIVIAGAAPQIAAHTLPDLLVGEGDVRSRQIIAHRAGPTGLGLAQHADRRAELARGTVAALEGVMVDERLLEGM